MFPKDLLEVLSRSSQENVNRECVNIFFLVVDMHLNDKLYSLFSKLRILE